MEKYKHYIWLHCAKIKSQIFNNTNAMRCLPIGSVRTNQLHANAMTTDLFQTQNLNNKQLDRTQIYIKRYDI